MTSLFDLNDNSSDSEDDQDYVPDVELSDKDVSEDEEITSSDNENSKLSKTKKATKKRSRRKQLCNEVEEKKLPEVKETPVNEKAKADYVWKSFLAVVSKTSKKEDEETSTSVTSSPPVISASLTPCTEGTSTSNTLSKNTAEKNCKVFEFAGETISVSTDVSVSDIIASDANSSKTDGLVEKEKDEPAHPAKRKGLQSVLGTIMNKKAKITTLQKTLIDWRTYKKDEGIEEELEKFNRGKGGFIERQRFLQRSDVRSYEIERDLRLTKVKKS